MVAEYHPRLYVACSFQKEASVIMDMLLKIEPSARFFTLDTGFLFEETKDTWRALEEKYDITVDVYKGITRRGAGRAARRRALEARPRRLLRHPQGHAAEPGAVDRRRLDRRPAPRPVAEPRRHAEGQVGRQARALEGPPARRLDRQGRLDLPRRERRAVQRPARPRLLVDRLHALHRRRPRTAPAAGPARGKIECGLHA